MPPNQPDEYVTRMRRMPYGSLAGGCLLGIPGAYYYPHWAVMIGLLGAFFGGLVAGLPRKKVEQ